LTTRFFFEIYYFLNDNDDNNNEYNYNDNDNDDNDKGAMTKSNQFFSGQGNGRFGGQRFRIGPLCSQAQGSR
jgi:hypothetical protein